MPRTIADPNDIDDGTSLLYFVMVDLEITNAVDMKTIVQMELNGSLSKEMVVQFQKASKVMVTASLIAEVFLNPGSWFCRLTLY